MLVKTISKIAAFLGTCRTGTHLLQMSAINYRFKMFTQFKLQSNGLNTHMLCLTIFCNLLFLSTTKPQCLCLHLIM